MTDSPESPAAIAAYLTPEYASAPCLPSPELPRVLLRHDLLFQPRPGVSRIGMIQYAQTAVRTVLASHDYRLTHRTVTPYEIFRELHNGDAKTQGRDLFDQDLLIIRARGDDYRRKHNGEPIDYLIDFKTLFWNRLTKNLPTWMIASAHCESPFFSAVYSRGTSDLTRFLQMNLVEVVFRDVGQNKIRFSCGSALMIDPKTGESQIRHDKSVPLSWDSSTPQEPKHIVPDRAVEPIPTPELASVDIGKNPVPTTTKIPSPEPELARQFPKTAAEIAYGEEQIRILTEDYERRVQQRLAAERQDAETSDPSQRLVRPRRTFHSRDRLWAEDDGGFDNYDRAPEEDDDFDDQGYSGSGGRPQPQSRGTRSVDPTNVDDAEPPPLVRSRRIRINPCPDDAEPTRKCHPTIRSRCGGR